MAQFAPIFCDTSQNTNTKAMRNFSLMTFLLGINFMLPVFSLAVAMEFRNPMGFNSTKTTPTPTVQILVAHSEYEGSYKIYNNHSLILADCCKTVHVVCRATYPIKWKPGSSLDGHYVFAYRSRHELSKTEQEHKSKQEDEGVAENPSQNSKEAPGNVNSHAEHSPLRKKNTTDSLHLHIFDKKEFFYYLEIRFTLYDTFGYLGSCQSIQKQIPEIGNKNGTTSARMENQENFLLEQKVDIFIPGERSMDKYLFGVGQRFKIISRRTIKNTNRSGFLIPCPLINATIAKEEPKIVNISLIQIFNEGKRNESVKVMDSEYNPEAGFYLWGREQIEGTFQCSAQPTVETNETEIEAQRETVTFEFVQNRGQYKNQGEEDWIDVTDEEDRNLDFSPKKNDDITASLSVDWRLLEVHCRLETPTAENSTLVPFGWFACETHVNCDMNVRHTYFINTEDAVEGLVPPHSALIQFTIRNNAYANRVATRNRNSISNPLVLYTNEEHSFECTVLEFLLTEDLVFLAHYKDGTRAFFPPGSINMDEIYPPGSQKIGIKVDVNVTLDMIAVICLAPWSTSSNWFEANISFTVKDVSKPKIEQRKENNQDENTFYIGDNGRRLDCSATGEPKPTFTWTKLSANGNQTWDVQTQKRRIHGNLAAISTFTLSEDGASLQFPKLTANHSGIYVCEARNRIGFDSKIFNVHVQVNPKELASGLSTGGIIGVVTGFIIFLVALVVTLLKYFQTKQKLRNLSTDEVDDFENGDPEALKNVQVEGENAHLLPFNRQYEVPDSAYTLDGDKILGSGEFGVVYSGKLREIDVAIKTTKSTANVDFFKAFLKEIKVMTFIGKHQNVVQLLGTSTSRIRERVVFVFVELGVHGALNSFLMKHQANFVDTLSSSQLFNVAPEQLISTGYTNLDSTIKITTLDLVKWCGQIAAGMAHLASKKIIHGDLAPRNVLLFDDYTAKITDFGLSRQLYASLNYTKTKQSPLPWRIMAPESLKYLQFSVKSDVWSFGVLVWEVFSLAAVPYSGLIWTHDFVDQLEQGLRLQKPNRASNEIYKNMCDCWNSEPENRPDFEQLENFYSGILGTAIGCGNDESQVIYSTLES